MNVAHEQRCRDAGQRLARLAGMLALFSASLCAHGADEWYTVEVAIFERTSTAALAEEYWSESVDNGRAGFTISASEGTGVGVLTAGTSEATSIQQVPAKGLAYGGMVSRMARSGVFRPLVHMGWRQPGLSKSEALPVRVGGASSASPDASEVRGTLRLYRSRYLHLEAELVYSRPDAAGAASNITGATRFALRESRRMRSGELHYLDHPLFGVLVRATPYQPPGGAYIPDPKTSADKPSRPQASQ